MADFEDFDLEIQDEKDPLLLIVVSMLRQIHKQLKIANVHLQNISDLELEDGDEDERY